MTPEEACGVLGVATTDGFDVVHRRYRRLMQVTHPDVATSGSPNEAPRVTAAFAEIRRAHAAGELPVAGRTTDPLEGRTDGEVLVLEIPSDDPFLYLLDMAHRLGEVTYQDAQAGLLMVLVDEPGEVCFQLTGEMTTEGRVTSVQFSLEPMGPGRVPSIATVVSRFGNLESRNQ